MDRISTHAAPLFALSCYWLRVGTRALEDRGRPLWGPAADRIACANKLPAIPSQVSRASEASREIEAGMDVTLSRVDHRPIERNGT
jgi:hypothetical protein